MSDIFKAIADPKARLVLEKLAAKPASTVAKAATATKLTSAQVTTILTSLSEAKLVKGIGSGAGKKYSLNGKGFAPYVSWLAKVAETQAHQGLPACSPAPLKAARGTSQSPRSLLTRCGSASREEYRSCRPGASA